MDVDLDPAMWQRRRRIRKVLVGGAVAALLAAALGAPLYSRYAERSKPRGISPPVGIAASASAPGPGYPDPFLRMTRAGIDSLDGTGLCKALCRTHLECAAYQHPDWDPSNLDPMLSMCNVSCGVSTFGEPDDPVFNRMARDCLYKFDCDLFVECAFGGPVPRSPRSPRSPMVPPASASAPPPARGKE